MPYYEFKKRKFLPFLWRGTIPAFRIKTENDPKY